MPRDPFNGNIPAKDSNVQLSRPDLKPGAADTWVPPGVTNEPPIATTSRVSSGLMRQDGSVIDPENVLDAGSDRPLTQTQQDQVSEKIGSLDAVHPPQSKPLGIGRSYTDTLARQPYSSVGTATAADWLALKTPYAFTSEVAASYVESVEGKGAVVSPAEKAALDTFFVAVEAEGFYSKMKRLSFPWFGNKVSNGVCALSGEVGSFSGTVTHGRGFVAGDENTGYFSWPTTLDALSITQIDSSIGTLVLSTNLLNDDRCYAGSQVGSKRITMQANNSSVYFASAIGNSATITEGKPNLRGMMVGTCTGVSARGLTRFRDGVATSATNSGGIADGPHAQPAFFMARNDDGTPNLHTGAEMGCFYLGQGLTEAEAETLAELVVDCYNAAFAEPTTNSIVILDDDIHENCHLNLFPMMQTYSIPMTFALVSDWVGDDGTISVDPRCSESELQEIFDAGGSFANHTKTHPYLANESVATIRTELETCDAYLLSKGWLEKHVVFPYSSTDQDVFEVSGESQTYGFGDITTTDSRYTNRLYSPRVALGYGQTETLAAIKSLIDDAVTNNAPLVLMTHCGLAGHSDADLVEVIEYAQSNGGIFRTARQAMNIHGRTRI